MPHHWKNAALNIKQSSEQNRTEHMRTFNNNKIIWLISFNILQCSIYKSANICTSGLQKLQKVWPIWYLQVYLSTTECCVKRKSLTMQFWLLYYPMTVTRIAYSTIYYVLTFRVLTDLEILCISTCATWKSQ